MIVSVYFEELEAFPRTSGPPTRLEFVRLANYLVGYDPRNSVEPLVENITLIEKEHQDDQPRRDTVPGG